MGLIVAVVMLLFVPGLRGSGSFGSDWLNSASPATTRESYFTALSKSAPAVVNIYSISVEREIGLFRNRSRERASLGSGVIMTDSGYILTCYHVVKDADDIRVAVQDQNRLIDAQLVGIDPATDLAVLKVNSENLHVIPQLEKTDIRVGDVVMAIGNPYNVGQTITQGIVSRTGRNGLSNFVDFIQTDAVLNQGNSGGALVDSNGYLVGITNANFQIRENNRVRQIDGINFAVPYALAKRIMDKIIANGRVVRGQLGFEGAENTNGAGGILVTMTSPNSAAERAGLRPGDLIVAIDGKALESAAKTLDLIAETAPGTKIELEISRDGEPLTLIATLDEFEYTQ